MESSFDPVGYIAVDGEKVADLSYIIITIDVTCE